MNDRALLEAAAKAAGIEHPGGNHSIYDDGRLWDCKALRWWNSLTTWDDAMELAARLEMTIAPGIARSREGVLFVEPGDDVSAATKRAITRCAAATLAGADGGEHPRNRPEGVSMPTPTDKTAAPAQPAAEPTASQWRVEWDNDTGADDGGYLEWWNVINDATETSYRAETKEAAERLVSLLNAQPAAEPAWITLTVEAVSQHFGNALARAHTGKPYTLNTGTAGIAFASLKPGMRLTAQVNERNYVVSAKVEGE